MGISMAIYIMIGIYAAIIISNPIIVTLHELGHAFAYLILTKPEYIDVFIGTYKDDSKIHFTVGKLRFHVKFSLPLISNGGMCQSSKAEPKHLKKIIILLAGPVFTFLIASLAGFLAFNSGVHGAVKLFCFALIICSFLSLYGNLMPHTISDTDIDSDGKQIAFVFKAGKTYRDYLSGISNFYDASYELCIAHFLKVYEKAPENERILRYLAISYLQLKNFDAAEKYLYELKGHGKLTTNDYANRGYLFSVTGRNDLAIIDYRKVLRKHPDHLHALNNLGYELILKGEYLESEELLKKGILLDANFAHSYSNLGLLKIMNNLMNAGKELIDKSIELDAENGYAFKHLGIYYLKTGERELAVINLKKAYELNDLIDINAYLQEAESLQPAMLNSVSIKAQL